MFRKFDIELFETTAEDVAFEHEMIVAVPKLDTKGIRAKVLRAE